MTNEEKKLWYTFLRNIPKHFVRQKAFGYYIADFYCAEAKLVIELDGSQHYESAREKYDAYRDEYFSQFGIQVVRYSDYDIAKHYEAVKKDICKRLGLE